jgi:hypothetical protein
MVESNAGGSGDVDELRVVERGRGLRKGGEDVDDPKGGGEEEKDGGGEWRGAARDAVVFGDE